MKNQNNYQQIITLLLIFNFIIPCTSLAAQEKEGKTEELNPLYVAGKDWYSEDPFCLLDDDLITGGNTSSALQEEKQTFNLTDYYNQLEPPEQGGLFGRYSILAEDSLYFLIPAFTIMGVIYLLPEDVSNWEKDDVNFQHGLDQWPDNVSSWEWDSDDDWINYIGHPYFGSSYYVYARHYGYSRLESFWFSFSISAFYEIGIEAWAEPVSIQDMIFTPLLGSLLGELLLPLEQQIKTNDNKVLGSEILGTVSLAVIDPFGHIVPPLKRWTKKLFSKDAELQLTPTFSYAEHEKQDGEGSGKDYRYGVQLTVQW
jgi:Domain of unknown function (DUF3943)